MSTSKFRGSIAAFATLWAFFQSLAQSPSGTPGETKDWQREFDDWHRKFPNAPSPTPASPSATPKAIDQAIKAMDDWTRQLEADRAIKHESDPKWSYSESTDAMGRGVTKIAAVESTNSVTFGSPYTGEQHATLKVQKRPDPYPDGSVLDFFLTIERGQFNFRYSSGSQLVDLAVRVDDHGSIEKFLGEQLSDGRANVVYILASDKLVAKLSGAKKVAIEAEFFREGTRVFEFDVHGLDTRKW